MITLENDELVFRFPEVHEHAICRIGFQRTLRIPDDGKAYPLPAGLKRFGLHHIDDHAPNLHSSLVKRGGIIMPMWQAEAMWLDFTSPTHAGSSGYPFAIKIATGKINAITGEEWTSSLTSQPQDYMVLPTQPWLDGYCVEKGVIRQFVAMPLGEGFTAEEQLTGDAKHGGLQILVFPMKREIYERDYLKEVKQNLLARMPSLEEKLSPSQMGLAPGGKMKQDIYEDNYGYNAWEQSHSSRCFMTILNALSWTQVTGENPPTPPITARQYKDAHIPWFDHYDTNQKALVGSTKLSWLKSIVGMSAGKKLPFDNGSMTPKDAVSVGPDMRHVREPHDRQR